MLCSSCYKDIGKDKLFCHPDRRRSNWIYKEDNAIYARCFDCFITKKIPIKETLRRAFS